MSADAARQALASIVEAYRGADGAEAAMAFVEDPSLIEYIEIVLREQASPDAALIEALEQSRDALRAELAEWKLEAERRGLPKEIMQAHHRETAELRAERDALDEENDWFYARNQALASALLTIARHGDEHNGEISRRGAPPESWAARTAKDAINAAASEAPPMRVEQWRREAGWMPQDDCIEHGLCRTCGESASAGHRNAAGECSDAIHSDYNRPGRPAVSDV